VSKSDSLLTTTEVAERCRVSTVTVGRWVRDGKLAAVRPGGNVLRFRRQDVDALLTPVAPEDVA